MHRLGRIFVVGLLLLATQLSAQSAPSFRGDLLGGGSASLSDYLKPNRALLVGFWATWCGPCIAELKQIQARIAADKTLPLDLLTVNVDSADTAADVKVTVRLHKFDFPIVLDPKNEILNKYTLVKALPHSVLVNSKGEIAATYDGFDESVFQKAKEIASSAGVRVSDAH